jgi:hypothetical protein
MRAQARVYEIPLDCGAGSFPDVGALTAGEQADLSRQACRCLHMSPIGSSTIKGCLLKFD